MEVSFKEFLCFIAMVIPYYIASKMEVYHYKRRNKEKMFYWARVMDNLERKCLGL
jgi:hypothetical protein